MNLEDLKLSITDDEINTLPLTHFEGEIVVVDDPKKVSNIIAELSIQNLLGFDTETRPSFQKGKMNSISLLQLSTSEKAYLFRLNKIGFPNGLLSLLSKKSIIKVGVALKDDVKGLRKITDFSPNGFLDLQDYVKYFRIENNGLRKLAGILLDYRISKSQRLSNWENGNLTDKQAIYAATDAWVSLEIYKKLQLIKLNNN